MAVLIDTSLLVEVERARADLGFLGDEDRAISVITVSELLHGIHRSAGAVRVRRRAVVEQTLAAFDAVPITEDVARVHAELWAELASSGIGVGAHDLWIGATAVTYGFGVATLDRDDFLRVPGLRVVAP